jgi:hypothetical protein
MSRRAFFSFHHKNDVWKSNIIRNSWVSKKDREAAGFIDAADFERVRKEGDEAIFNWIDGQLHNTSVTVVLIGTLTYKRKYVKYEIHKSFEKGNGILGIYIHELKDHHGETSLKGSIKFGQIGIGKDGKPVHFEKEFLCYEWVADDGYNNLGDWIEAAAKKAGR